MAYDLEKLNAVDTNDPAAVKDLQQFLKTRGYYKGAIDGQWGGGTTEGAKQLKNELLDTAKTGLETAKINQETNSPLNNALRGATEFGPYAGGAGLGMWAGHAGANALNNRWANDAAQTKAMAGDSKISGVVAEGKMGSMRGARNTITGAQFLAPAALLGSAEFIRGHVAPNFEGETKKWINLGANADQGAGLGLAAHQLLDLRNRIASPADASDEARIETRAAAERAPTPPPPATRPNSERLIAAAKAAGATGKMSKAAAADYLGSNVTEANRAAVLAELPAATTAKTIASTVKRLAAKPGSSSILAPLIGAGVAYDAASGDAEAAGATPGEARTEGVKAGAAGAGLSYGLAKLLQKLPTAGMGEAMAPSAVDSMTNYSPEDIAKARNWIARNAPFAAVGAPMRQAYDMAQVPQRAPGLPQAAMGAGPQVPQEAPPMPMRRPQLPYAPMGYGGGY